MELPLMDTASDTGVTQGGSGTGREGGGATADSSKQVDTRLGGQVHGTQASMSGGARAHAPSTVSTPGPNTFGGLASRLGTRKYFLAEGWAAGDGGGEGGVGWGDTGE